MCYIRKQFKKIGIGPIDGDTTRSVTPNRQLTNRFHDPKHIFSYVLQIVTV